MEVQAWLRSRRRIFKGLEIGNRQKRFLASLQLQEGALARWEAMIQNEPEDGMTWDQFKEVLEEQYMQRKKIPDYIEALWI